MAASGYLTSPTMGGQSWLPHGTLESGLWIADQQLYDLLVTSDRLTLTKAFDRAGRHTVTVRPAITMPWPEGPLLGYQTIYAAKDLGYRGKPYNWITMPDQYTLAAFERLERLRPHPPLYAEMALISSHAPWTPIPPVLERWSTIGDGEIFSQWADQGDPPDVVWRDPERVRKQYALAIDYVLGVLASYAARFVDDRTLLILVGDHQPAPRHHRRRRQPRRAHARDQRLTGPARAVPSLRLHARHAPPARAGGRAHGPLPRHVPSRLQRAGRGFKAQGPVVIVRVECHAGHRGEATPRRVWFEGRPVELVEVQDAWLAPDHRYFKMRGADGAAYILRHDERSGLWQLTLYQAASRPAGSAGADPMTTTSMMLATPVAGSSRTRARPGAHAKQRATAARSSSSA